VWWSARPDLQRRRAAGRAALRILLLLLLLLPHPVRLLLLEIFFCLSSAASFTIGITIAIRCGGEVPAAAFEPPPCRP
jgi:hypothetical protein